MNPEKALEIIKQVVESVSLNFKDHQMLQEAIAILGKEIMPKEPKVVYKGC